MTVTALCLEMGAFGETFAYDLAAALGVQVLDLRPLELGMAEWHLFCNGAAVCGGADESPRVQPTAPELEERSIRIAAKIVEAAKGDALIVGWSAAAVLAPLSRVTRVCIRAPRPQQRGAICGISSTAPYPTERPDLHLSRFMNRTTDPKWLDLNDFDLILDSGRMSAEECQREIIALVERRRGRETAATLIKRERHSTPLREPDRGLPTWRSLRGCSVTVGADNVPLAGIESQEAAIARVERHLRGPSELSVPANPLCRRESD